MYFLCILAQLSPPTISYNKKCAKSEWICDKKSHSSTSCLQFHVLTTDMSSSDFIQKDSIFKFYVVQLESTHFSGGLQVLRPAHHDTTFGQEIYQSDPASVFRLPKFGVDGMNFHSARSFYMELNENVSRVKTMIRRNSLKNLKETLLDEPGTGWKLRRWGSCDESMAQATQVVSVPGTVRPGWRIKS